MRISDWSSDVCSSDLRAPTRAQCAEGFRREPPRVRLVADAATRAAAAHRGPDDRERPRLCVGSAPRALPKTSDPQGCRGVAARRNEPERTLQVTGHEPRAY